MKKLFKFSQRFKQEEIMMIKIQENENKTQGQNISIPFVTSPNFEPQICDYNNKIGII